MMKELLPIISIMCIALIFLILVAFCIVPYFSYKRCERLLKNGKRTEGEIIMLRAIGLPAFIDCIAMYSIHVSYTVDNKEYTAELPTTPLCEETDFMPYFPAVGERISLIYDEKRPQSPIIGVKRIVERQAEEYYETWERSRWFALMLTVLAVSVIAILL